MQVGQLKRRQFITLLGGAAAWPLAARAQQPAMPVVGVLSIGSRTADTVRLIPIGHGLGQIGYIEGKNVAIEYRGADYQNDRLASLAADLVRRQVTAIVTTGAPSAQAAKAATNTIPIIFYSASDPVEEGLVASLNRPAGNLTGISGLTVELGPKRLELLHELIPTATTLALLVNPTNANAEPQSQALLAAAIKLGVTLHILHAKAERDFEAVFAKLADLRVGGFVIGSDPFLTAQSAPLAGLSLRHAVPAIGSVGYREFPLAGGLMSYGASNTDAYRLVGVYTGRILKGERPEDLPVQRATKVELIINLKAATLLGITFPLPLLGRADEVIE